MRTALDRWAWLTLMGMLGLSGCRTTPPSAFSDADSQDLTLTVEAIHANDAGLTYGVFFKQGKLSNDIFHFAPAYAPFGFVADLENRTEFPISVTWESCALVDSEGWSHSIVYPDFSELYKEGVYPAVVVAPMSKRRIAFASRAMLGRAVVRPGNRGSFHPSLAEIPDAGIQERLILCLDYRGRELLYDITVGISKRERRAIRRSDDAPATPPS